MKKIYIDKLPKNHIKADIVDSLIKDDFIEVEFFYDSKFENTKHLRDFVDIICERLAFSDKQKSRFILIADELNNNAIEYWSSTDAENILRIKLSKIDWKKVFKLEVQDKWNWKHPKTALDMETMRAHKLKVWYFGHDSIRWRWLFLIIVKLVDRLYFKNSADWWLVVGIKTFLT